MNRTPLILGILLLWGLNCLAQQTFTGHVIDKQTGKGIPFASVYVSEDKGTIANEEGTFTITLEVSDSIRVSSIGYTTFCLSEKYQMPQRTALQKNTMDSFGILSPRI